MQRCVNAGRTWEKEWNLNWQSFWLTGCSSHSGKHKKIHGLIIVEGWAFPEGGARLLKGKQEWEFFWLRFGIFYYFIVSYAEILRFLGKTSYGWLIHFFKILVKIPPPLSRDYSFNRSCLCLDMSLILAAWAWVFSLHGSSLFPIRTGKKQVQCTLF
jgi:hypothetical protein